MRYSFIVLAAGAGLLIGVSNAAAAQAPTVGYSDAVAVFFDMDAPPAVRQNALVRFDKPVRIGTRVLMGKYIIEHDTERMARGEPCTHVYDFYSRKLVTAFHCTHLTRPRAGDTATVSVKPAQDLPAVMTEFQFAGETDAHGVPGVR